MDHNNDVVRWIHISDFHLKANQSYDSDRVLNALINSIPDLIERIGGFDFIVASGDVAYSGKSVEYVQATKFFDKILSTAKIDKSRLIIVPGNHDVDRFHNNSLSRTFSNVIDVDNYFDMETERPHIALRQNEFIKWYNEYFSGISDFSKISSLGGLTEFEIRGRNFKIFRFNSAIFSTDETDQGKLLMGRRCLENAFTVSPIDEAVRIAVMHHPTSWLSSVESSNVKSILRDNSDVIMFGHLHETDVEQGLGLTGTALELAAGASYQGSEWPNTALLCTLEDHKIIVLPIQFVDRPRPAWTVDPSVFPNSTNFTRTFEIERLKKGPDLGKMAQIITATPSEALEKKVSEAYNIWRDDLILTSGGVPIYVEPRIMTMSQDNALEAGLECAAISVEELACSPKSFIIEGRPEYGSTNLARRLVYEIDRSGNRALFRDAYDMPNYKAKLIQDITAELTPVISPVTIVIDNFHAENHRKLLKEIHSTNLVKRVILVSPSRDLTLSIMSDLSQLDFSLERIFLWPMNKAGLRESVSSIFDTIDKISIHEISDKIYNDLLALCIPLSPRNVIMYAKVLVKETNFTPLNRVHIQNRYIIETLSRSDDVYRGNFNAKNKVDVISAFTYHLYLNKISNFSQQDWFRFCESHKAAHLKEFDDGDLLDELNRSGIIYKFNSKYVFKYAFFYHYFFGRHLASHRSLLNKFMDDGEYLTIPQIVDIVTGLEADNNEILKKLSTELDKRLIQFADKYVDSDFDPLLQAVWPDVDDEEKKLWKPVQEAIASGPGNDEEIDKLKTSVTAEARTADQQVRFIDFVELEHALFNITTQLADALRNSDEASADAKLAALEGLLRAELVAFQVGTMFADKLLSRRYFRWGSIMFRDFNKIMELGESNSVAAIVSVVVALSQSVATKLADQIGTFKLAGVFRARAERSKGVGFLDLLLFACILEAKGTNWDKTLELIILRFARDAFYLRIMLGLLMRSLRIGLEKGSIREATKRLVALIQAKRSQKKMAPGEKLISKIKNRLEEEDYFSSAKE